MTNALQPDAQKTPESNSLPSLPVDHHTTDRSHLDLNSDLDVNDPGPQEVTSQHVTTPDATAALPLPQAEPTLKLLDPKKISIAEMPNRTPEAYEDEAFESLCQSMVAQGGITFALLPGIPEIYQKSYCISYCRLRPKLRNFSPSGPSTRHT